MPDACASWEERELRVVLARDDDYRGAGKPVCDWEDREAREELVDALARDARAVLAALDGRELVGALEQAGELLATVVGQDLEGGVDGRFRIARKVAKDRVISTVDKDARHGHKTAARGFDGYKGHVAIDPDSEVILATSVTAGNVGDAAAVGDLLARDLPAAEAAETGVDLERLTVYGDSAYGTALCWTPWNRQGSRRGARPNRPGRLVAGSPRRTSQSIWMPAR